MIYQISGGVSIKSASSTYRLHNVSNVHIQITSSRRFVHSEYYYHLIQCSLYDVLYRYKISISKTFWISRIKFEQFESVFITCVSIVPIPPPPAPGFLVLLSKQDSVTSGPDSRPRPANWKSQSVLRRQTAASYRSVCPYLAWGGRWPDAGTSPARAAAAWATDLLAMFDEENFQAATTLLAKIWGIVIVKHWC